MSHDYIFYFDYSPSYLIFYFSLEKCDYSFILSLSLSLSLSLYIYIYIYIIYSFLQLYFRLMNHYIFYNTILGQTICFFFFSFNFPSQVFFLPLISFVSFLFDIILSYFGSENEFISKYDLGYVYECAYQLFE